MRFIWKLRWIAWQAVSIQSLVLVPLMLVLMLLPAVFEREQSAQAVHRPEISNSPASQSTVQYGESGFAIHSEFRER